MSKNCIAQSDVVSVCFFFYVVVIGANYYDDKIQSLMLPGGQTTVDNADFDWKNDTTAEIYLKLKPTTTFFWLLFTKYRPIIMVGLWQCLS